MLEDPRYVQEAAVKRGDKRRRARLERSADDVRFPLGEQAFADVLGRQAVFADVVMDDRLRCVRTLVPECSKAVAQMRFLVGE